MSKKITWIEGSSLLTGAVIGSGILILPISVVQLVNTFAVYSWGIMLLISIPTIITLYKLAILFPDKGGFASYANNVFGSKVGKLVSYLFILTVPLSAPVASIIAGKYVTSILHNSIIYEIMIVVSLLILSIILNIWGLKISGRIQSILLLTIISIIVMTIYSGISQIDINYDYSYNVSLSDMSSSFIIVFWALVGWEVVINLTDEFEKPKKNILISLIVSYILVSITYMLLIISIVYNPIYMQNIDSITLPLIIEHSFGANGKIISSIIGVIACYGTMHIYVAAFARQIQSRALAGDFPHFFSKLNNTYKTPTRVLYSMLIIFFIIIFTYYYFQIDFNFMLQLPSSIFMLIYTIGLASALKLLTNRLYKFFASISCLIFFLVLISSGYIMIICFAITTLVYIFIVISERKRVYK